MNPVIRLGISVLALAMGIGFGAAAPVPALAARPDCASNANLWHVHRRLDGAIDQLQHDQRDYGGHRVAAINDLNNARNQLVAAEQYAVNVDHDNPACFQAHGPTGGSDAPWGLRGQGGSNRDIRGVDRWVENLIDQLNRDQRDYGGHRAAAVADMQQARNEMRLAEIYARQHGY